MDAMVTGGNVCLPLWQYKAWLSVPCESLQRADVTQEQHRVWRNGTVTGWSTNPRPAQLFLQP